MFEQYVVNNISYSHPMSKEFDPKQIKSIGVCLNFIDNKTYELHSVLEATKNLQNFVDPDLFISNIKVDEYDGQFVNLCVRLESYTNKDLIDLMYELTPIMIGYSSSRVMYSSSSSK